MRGAASKKFLRGSSCLPTIPLALEFSIRGAAIPYFTRACDLLLRTATADYCVCIGLFKCHSESVAGVNKVNSSASDAKCQSQVQ